MTKSRSSIFHTRHCSDCGVGLNRVVMAIRTIYSSAATAELVWIHQLNGDSNSFKVKGQIVGSQGKLIMRVSSGSEGYVMAIS